MGSGGARNRSGVAVLVHKRWAHAVASFAASNDGLCWVDIDFDAFLFRLASVYMPDSTYPEEDVET
eukprot:8540574-Pyramimonas_sp.AAC.1